MVDYLIITGFTLLTGSVLTMKAATSTFSLRNGWLISNFSLTASSKLSNSLHIGKFPKYKSLTFS